MNALLFNCWSMRRVAKLNICITSICLSKIKMSPDLTSSKDGWHQNSLWLEASMYLPTYLPTYLLIQNTIFTHLQVYRGSKWWQAQVPRYMLSVDISVILGHLEPILLQLNLLCQVNSKKFDQTKCRHSKFASYKLSKLLKMFPMF